MLLPLRIFPICLGGLEHLPQLVELLVHSSVLIFKLGLLSKERLPNLSVEACRRCELDL